MVPKPAPVWLNALPELSFWIGVPKMSGLELLAEWEVARHARYSRVCSDQQRI